MTADRMIDRAQGGRARGKGVGGPVSRRAVTRRGTPLGALAAFALLTTLSACGQKGPLYLPDSGGEVVTRPSGNQGQSGAQGQSGETAPQPSTQPTSPQQQRSDDEKKSQTPPR